MRKPYPSDLTDEQWAILGPMIPINTDGRPPVVDMREVVDAILYLDRSGCQWDMLTHDLPAKSTVYDHFARWGDDGTWGRIQEALRRRVREAAPKVGCIDSQTVKGAEVGGARGYDGGQKRHIIVDSMGLLPAVLVTAAYLDDGTHARHVLARLTAEQCIRLEAVRDVRRGGRRAPSRLGRVREGRQAMGRGADLRLDRPLAAQPRRLRAAGVVVGSYDHGRIDPPHAPHVGARSMQSARTLQIP